MRPQGNIALCGWTGAQGRLSFSHLSLWHGSFEEHFSDLSADSRKEVKFGFIVSLSRFLPSNLLMSPKQKHLVLTMGLVELF